MRENQLNGPNNSHSPGLKSEDENSSKNENKKRKKPGRYPSWMNALLWILIFAFIFTWLQSPGGGIFSQASEVSYSEFRAQLQEGNVESIHVQGEQIQGQLKESRILETTRDDTTQYESFITYIPSFGDEGLFEMLEEQNVDVSSQPESDFNYVHIPNDDELGF